METASPSSKTLLNSQKANKQLLVKAITDVNFRGIYKVRVDWRASHPKPGLYLEIHELLSFNTRIRKICHSGAAYFPQGAAHLE
jgi:hypothetical protein